GASSALFPPDPTAENRRRGRARGLNDTSTIPSPPPDSLSPASSPAGSLVVPSAITLGSDHARALGSSTRCPNTRNESFRHSSARKTAPGDGLGRPLAPGGDQLERSHRDTRDEPGINTDDLRPNRQPESRITDR